MPRMTFHSMRRLACLTVGGAAFVAVTAGCTHGMRARMDAAWETLDPMGHRKIHQEQDFVRGRSTGVKMPKGAKY